MVSPRSCDKTEGILPNAGGRVFIFAVVNYHVDKLHFGFSNFLNLLGNYFFLDV